MSEISTIIASIQTQETEEKEKKENFKKEINETVKEAEKDIVYECAQCKTNSTTTIMHACYRCSIVYYCSKYCEEKHRKEHQKKCFEITTNEKIDVSSLNTWFVSNAISLLPTIMLFKKKFGGGVHHIERATMDGVPTKFFRSTFETPVQMLFIHMTNDVVQEEVEKPPKERQSQEDMLKEVNRRIESMNEEQRHSYLETRITEYKNLFNPCETVVCLVYSNSQIITTCSINHPDVTLIDEKILETLSERELVDNGKNKQQ